jgi:branched-chain amino acid transport system permease protein
MRTGHYKETYGQLIALNDNLVVWAWAGLLLAALLLLPIAAGGYVASLFTRVMVVAIGVVGLNMLTGKTGLISLGHAGFLAVGAYTNTILLTDYGWPVELTIVAAGVVSAMVSLLVGVPSLRLRGLYLAITTLAFAFIINHVILMASDWTRGNRGMFLPRTNFLGIDIGSSIGLYYVVLGLTVLMTLIALNILRSRIGRAWMAIRDHDIAAKVMGVDLVFYKLLAFMVSSFFIGVSGALLSLELRFINVDVFSLLISIEALAMIILGGLGSVAGAILGAAFLVLLPEVIRVVFGLFGTAAEQLFSNYVFQIREILYGVVIVLMLRLEPHGLIGVWRNAKKYWTNWPLAFR